MFVNSENEKNMVMDLCEFVNIVKTEKDSIIEENVFINVDDIPNIASHVVIINIDHDLPKFYPLEER